jgi:hypothetical protein
MEVMNVLKFVLDGEFTNEDVLPKLLKTNKDKFVRHFNINSSSCCL